MELSSSTSIVHLDPFAQCSSQLLVYQSYVKLLTKKLCYPRNIQGVWIVAYKRNPAAFRVGSTIPLLILKMEMLLPRRVRLDIAQSVPILSTCSLNGM